MAECQNVRLAGLIKHNYAKELRLPSPFSWSAMQAQSGDLRIHDLEVWNLSSGSKEVANELLDFLIEKCNDRGLSRICFTNTDSSVTEIEPQLITLLAQKAKDLIKLYIMGNRDASAQMKQDLANLTVNVFLQGSPNLKEVALGGNGWSSEIGGKICSAIAESRITSFVTVYLSSNPSWFDSAAKCEAWAKIFRKQRQLASLSMKDCNLSSSAKATIKAACPPKCKIGGMD